MPAWSDGEWETVRPVYRANAVREQAGTTLVELCHVMPRPALYVWTVSITGVAVIVISGLQVIWFPLPFSWLALAGLALLSGLTVLRLPFSASFSVGDAFSFAALFLYGTEAAT
jgi:hypothetical protein